MANTDFMANLGGTVDSGWKFTPEMFGQIAANVAPIFDPRFADVSKWAQNTIKGQQLVNQFGDKLFNQSSSLANTLGAALAAGGDKLAQFIASPDNPVSGVSYTPKGMNVKIDNTVPAAADVGGALAGGAQRPFQ